MPDAPVTVRVAGRTLRLTHLDKVLYPETGTTKAEVIGYVTAVAPVLLPQLAGRPITRKRWPDGVDGQVFFEKNVPRGHPSWVRTATFHHADRGRGREPRDVAYVLADDEATLVWLAQLAALELHTPQWRVGPDGDRLPADRLVVDLDPGPPAGLAECAAVAREAREILAGAGLSCIPVLSGSKGLHLYADLPPGGLDPSALAQTLAEALAGALPELVVGTMARAERRGRVYVDWSQNNPAKTTITPYSLRGRSRPTVATPVTWDELEDGTDLRQFEFPEVLDRVTRLGDLMHPDA